MKITLIVVFNIISLISVSSKNLKPSDIFKGRNSEKNKTKHINSTNDCSLKDQGNFEGPKKDKEISIVIPVFSPDGVPPSDLDKEIKDIKVQNDKNLSLEKQILFLASCLKGGLTSDKQILNAYEWALENNYIRNDKYDDLAQKISKQFKTDYHDDWKIRKIKNQHSCDIISKRKIIFNYDKLRNDANKIFNSFKE